MKKLLTLLTTLPLVCGASDYDLIKGIDLTGIVGGPTYSQLNQLVDNGIINTNNKGIIFVTAGNTNPTATPFGRAGLTNYLWLDRTTDPPYLKSFSYANYVVSGGANGWVNVAQATIAINSIDHTMLQTAAVWTTNILDASITQAKIPANSWNQGFLLDGAISSNKIANAGIQASNIAPLAITAALIATNTITSNQVALGGLSWTNMQGYMPSNWLGPDAVNGTKVLDRSLGNTDLITNSITSNELASAGIARYNLETNVSSGIAYSWIKFSGTNGTVLGSWTAGSVATVASNGIGDFTVTIGRTMADTNYAISLSYVNQQTTITTNTVCIVSNQTTTTFGVRVHSSGVGQQVPAIYTVIHGN